MSKPDSSERLDEYYRRLVKEGKWTGNGFSTREKIRHQCSQMEWVLKRRMKKFR